MQFKAEGGIEHFVYIHAFRAVPTLSSYNETFKVLLYPDKQAAAAASPIPFLLWSSSSPVCPPSLLNSCSALPLTKESFSSFLMLRTNTSIAWFPRR